VISLTPALSQPQMFAFTGRHWAGRGRNFKEVVKRSFTTSLKNLPSPPK